MIPCWLQWAIALTTLAANIVTVSGIIAAFVKFRNWIKNSVDEKRIKLTAEMQEPTVKWGFDKRIIVSKLKVCNETNRELFVETITLIQDGKPQKLEFRTDLDRYFDKIHILPYENKEISGYFIMPPYPHHLAINGTIKLSTNIRPLEYNIALPKDNTN